MNKEATTYLNRLLVRIEAALRKMRTGGSISGREARLYILSAALKEQIENEDTRSSTRTSR